jgi:TatD DNase family protein
MIDAHCHIPAGDASRQFVIGVDFAGIHPCETFEMGSVPTEKLSALSDRLAAEANLGVGEIGMDRLKKGEISPVMRETFIAQLELAAKFRRRVVLHGAKCWGQVVAECRRYADSIPAFLFHGFSRSGGLLADIAALNGFVSVGPAVLNDHAVNYRELVRKIPAEMLLLETDRTAENAAQCPNIEEIALKVAQLRALTLEELEALVDSNAKRFCGND